MDKLKHFYTLFLLASGLTLSLAVYADNIRQIEVSGIGKVHAVPDMANVQFSFSERSRDAIQAKKRVDTQVTNLLKLCENLGIEEKDIHAAQLNIHPEYDYKRDRQLLGYRVTRNIRVKIRDLEQYPKFLAGAVGIGAQHGGNASFGFSDRQSLENEAMLKAFEHAKAKAKLLAKQASTKLGDVLMISETGSMHIPQPRMANMMAAESADARYPTGEMEISKQLQVRFALK